MWSVLCGEKGDGSEGVLAPDSPSPHTSLAPGSPSPHTSLAPESQSRNTALTSHAQSRNTALTSHSQSHPQVTVVWTRYTSYAQRPQGYSLPCPASSNS
jgi:hypothetical protein